MVKVIDCVLQVLNFQLVCTEKYKRHFKSTVFTLL